MCAAAILFAACNGISNEPIALPPTNGMSKAAATYLTNVLDIMESTSINRHKVAWASVRSAVAAKATSAKATADTYDAIRHALTLIQDTHGAFYGPSVAVGGGTNTSDPPTMPVGNSIGPTAYLRVPSFTGSAASARRYADSLQLIIHALDDSAPCGWIVDLRSNDGSNMYPMIAGIGSLTGESVLGLFVDPDSVKLGWFYSGGTSGVVDSRGAVTVVHRLSNTGYTLRSPASPIAIVAGAGTASSGEAVLISFRGRANTRSFGERTGGVSTATVQYTLSDGATLLLTTSTMADRAGHVYGGSLDVDETVAGTSRAASSTDPAALRAVSWLRSQSTCGGR
jgi:carboxyl-terminal processing protease